MTGMIFKDIICFYGIGNGWLQSRIAGEKSIGINKDHKGCHVVEGRARNSSGVGKIYRVIVVQFLRNK
jgi:hypothetical protein